MKTICAKFDKKVINTLPVVSFPGKIVVIQSESDAKKAVDFLLQQPIIGLDTETRPCFKKGQTHKVALLQVSTHDICFLFRLNFIGMPACVKRLLSDRKVLKIGLSWKDDLTMLRRREDFTVGTFTELQTLVRELGIQDMSLQKLYANLYGQKISKSQQLTNWEADTFTEKQKLYAATDAWACIMLYEEVMRLKSEDFELIEPETEDE